jgi:hypothetical protein
VRTGINHVANDDEECSRSVEIAETQTQLFAEFGHPGISLAEAKMYRRLG